jgi:hypothetical protein
VDDGFVMATLEVPRGSHGPTTVALFGAPLPPWDGPEMECEICCHGVAEYRLVLCRPRAVCPVLVCDACRTGVDIAPAAIAGRMLAATGGWAGAARRRHAVERLVRGWLECAAEGPQ